MLIVLGRECLELKGRIRALERETRSVGCSHGGQDEHAGVAPEDFQRRRQEKHWRFAKRKHKLVKCEGERERARMLQGMELSGAVGHFPELWTMPPLVLAHPLWHMTPMKQCPLPPGWHKMSWTAGRMVICLKK